MLDDTKVRDLARLYAGMTPQQVSDHEDWVRRYKAEQVLENEKADAAYKERQEALRKASDVEAVQMVLQRCGRGEDGDTTEPYDALDMLKATGYHRTTSDMVAFTVDVIEHLTNQPNKLIAQRSAERSLFRALERVGYGDAVKAFQDAREKTVPPVVFKWCDLDIRTMADAIAADGSWEAFCRKVANLCRRPAIHDPQRLLETVASLVPEELRDAHRTNMERLIDSPSDKEA